MRSQLKTPGELRVWLLRDALTLWWEKGADHAHGGFHDALGPDGNPILGNKRARVQARQIYVYATAGRLGWEGPWREAVECGLSFFPSRFRRNDGLLRTVVSTNGAPVDESAWLYDQAFALLALAHAQRAIGSSRDLTCEARELRDRLDGWRLESGGFREASIAHPFQSNPHMHLFEACLAWIDVAPDSRWTRLAEEIVNLALDRFIDANGALREFFDGDWTPVPGPDGRIVEPGHQFEWAWLLERWSRRSGDDQAHCAALRLYKRGCQGIDHDRGVVLQQVLDDGTVRDATSRLWPQTEWMKAAHIFGDTDGLARASNALGLYLDRGVWGIWWDKLRPNGEFVDEPAPASSFYHIVCALAEVSSSDCA